VTSLTQCMRLDFALLAIITCACKRFDNVVEAGRFALRVDCTIEPGIHGSALVDENRRVWPRSHHCRCF
jgi:hypothetical protein